MIGTGNVNMDTKELSINRYNTRKFDEIDALKGIAIFLVVLGHSIIVYPINLHENAICDFLFRWLSSVHMPLFFCISGYCFSYNNKYLSYIVKKIKRIFIPFLFFNILDMCMRMIFSGIVNNSRGIIDSIKNIIFYGGAYWFLYSLFLIFLIYPFIYRFIKNSYVKQIGLIVLMIIVDTFLKMPTSLMHWLVFFSIGVLLKNKLGDKIFTKKDGRNNMCLIVILTMVWMSLIMFQAKVTYLTAIIGIMDIYFLVNKAFVTQYFKAYGKYSLQLYLLNGFLLVISRTLVVSILNINNPIIIIVFNMLVNFYASYWLIKNICEKLKISKILMGMV